MLMVACVMFMMVTLQCGLELLSIFMMVQVQGTMTMASKLQSMSQSEPVETE